MAESVFFGLVWSAATPSLHTNVAIPPFLSHPSSLLASPIPLVAPYPSLPIRSPSPRRPPLTLFTPQPAPRDPSSRKLPRALLHSTHTTAGRNNKQPPVAMATRPSRANKTLHPLSVTLTPSPRQPGRPVFSLFTLQHSLFPPEMCFFL